MIVEFTATFFLLANPGMALAPRLGGFDTRSACGIFATKVIQHIKAGAGENYQPIGFKCEPNKAGR